MESPYIVGPYLKPSYLPTTYMTDEIRSRHDNDLNYFIYKPTLLENNDSRTVKLLLIDDVEGLGVSGQVVDVPYRLGASKLIAMKKAEYANDFSLSWYKFGPRTLMSASSALSPRTARLLRSQVFDLPIFRETQAEAWHIALALRLAGCQCPMDAIEADSMTNYDGDDGEAYVRCTIKINNHEKVETRFKKTRQKQVED